MKRIVVLEPKQFAIEEVSEPKINRKNSLIVKVNVGGICGSDMHILHGLNPFATYPRVIGHEISGVVFERGVDVKDIAIGEQVCINPTVSCGHCRTCTMGRPNICLNLNVLGVHRDGGFAEYIEVQRDNLFPLPAELDSAFGSMVEPYSIASNVLSRIGFSGNGEDLLVFGSGVIGLVILDYAVALGGRVTVVDIAGDKLEFARQMGAEHTINSLEEDVESCVDSISGGMGFSNIADAACVPDLFPLMMRLASFGGTVGLLGFLSEPAPVAELDIVKKELKIVGSRLNNQKFPEVLGLMKKARLNPDKMVSHRFAMDKFADAIKLIESAGRGLRKVVLDF